MKNIFRLALLTLCALAPLREVSAAFLIRDGKLQTDLNANTNRITNATDIVTVGGVSLTNLAANLGCGTGTLYRVESQVSGLGFMTPNGPTAFLTGTVATAGSFADTNSVGVISTNAVNQATNFVTRAGDTMTGNLIITNASITVKSDSINAQFSDARGAAGVLLQTGSPSAATNTYGVVKLQDSGPSAGYGTLYFDSRVSPTGLWIKASGTNRWNVWDQRNDGAGSGLDADLLDGLESTNFAQLASSPTFAGTVAASAFTGQGAGLSGIDSGALTNLGSGLALSGGKLTATNGLAQVLANGVNAAGASATNLGTVQAGAFVGDGSALTGLSTPLTIFSQTLAGQTNSIGFSVPATNGFDKLTIEIHGTVTNASGFGFIYAEINSNTAASCYGYQQINGNSNTVIQTGGVTNDTGALFGYLTSGAGARTAGHITATIPTYTNNYWEKVVQVQNFVRNGAGAAGMRLQFHNAYYMTTNAITHVRIYVQNGQYSTGTIFKAVLSP